MRKKPPAYGSVASFSGGKPKSCCGYVEGCEIRAAESARAGTAHRQWHNAIGAPVRGIAHQTTAIKNRVPQKSFTVDRGTVRYARNAVHRSKFLSPANRAAVDVEFVTKMVLTWLSAKYMRRVVRAPANAVGHPNAVGDQHQVAVVRSDRAGHSRAPASCSWSRPKSDRDDRNDRH